MDARELLEKYRQNRKTLVEDLRSLDSLIRRIEIDIGETASQPEEISEFLKGEEDSSGGQTSTSVRRGRLTIGPDLFFGMTHGDAAKKYLEMTGQAVSLEELVEALNKGGCRVGGADPKRTLYISLVRNTRDFVPPQAGYIGLRKFYPALKASQTKKVGSKKKSKKVTKK